MKGHKELFHHLGAMLLLSLLGCLNSLAQYNGECWALDYLNAIKISGNKATRFSGFSQPMSISINVSDGSVWVADTDAVRVKKLSASGKVLATIENEFQTQPISVAVDPRDGSCWVATTDTVYKFSQNAKKMLEKQGFSEPVLALNQKNGECWIADSNNARIVRLAPDGTQLAVYTIDGLSQIKSISINQEDGTCWVIDPFAQRAVKLSPDGQLLVNVSVAPPGGATMATCVSASTDGGCWISFIVDFMTPNKDIVMKVSADGKQTLTVSGFHMPSTVAFDPKDKGCWVADSNNGRIVKLSSTGQKILTLSGFGQPKAVTVGYTTKK